MSGYGLIEQLTAIVKYLMDYPQGLSMLLGTVPPPSCEAIAEMLESARPVSEPTQDPKGNLMRVDGGDAAVAEADRRIDSEERWNSIIERAGGWTHIVRVTCEWTKAHPRNWSVVVDHVRWVRPNLWRVDGAQLDRIADIHGLGRSTVHRIVQTFAQGLATAIVNTPTDSDFTLSEKAV